MAPHVSLILVVKNGMPYVREAVRSIEEQTYRDFELVVQDGGSTDGTVEFLRSVDRLPSIDVVSAPDGGIGDAYNRAVARCTGSVVGSIDADNLLDAAAVATAVGILTSRPDLAAVYGASRMIDAEGAETGVTFMPDAFDLVRVLACEVVPPFGSSFFNVAVCGHELGYDERLSTCADYDLWLRLGHLPIAVTDVVVAATRLSPASMSQRPAEYDAHCRNKLTALEWFLSPYDGGALIDAVRRRSQAGIWLWGAESLYALEGRRERFERYLQEAERLDPESPRLSRARAFPGPTVVPDAPVTEAAPVVQPDEPPSGKLTR